MNLRSFWSPLSSWGCCGPRVQGRQNPYLCSISLAGSCHGPSGSPLGATGCPPSKGFSFNEPHAFTSWHSQAHLSPAL